MSQSNRHHLELATRAKRDLKHIPKRQRDRVVEALEQLSPNPHPENLDVETISGHPPFLRLRAGDYRVLFRPLSRSEMDRLVMSKGCLDGPTGYLISRIVNRRDLERAVERLELVELN